MSQRTFTSNGNTALAGYDRPLDYFFLTIEDATGEMIYSNLIDPEGPSLDFDQIADRLKRFEMEAPPGLYEDLANDKFAECRAGRSYIQYDYAS